MSTQRITSNRNPVFGARIDPELAEWVKAEADRNGRLPARELEMMLRELRERRAGGDRIEGGGSTGTACVAVIRNLVSDEATVQALARALLERIDYGDHVKAWEELEPPDRELYCAGIEAVLHELMRRLAG